MKFPALSISWEKAGNFPFNNIMKTLLTYILFSIVIFAGCEKPGPIELVDTSTPSQSISIDTTGTGQQSLITSNPSVDSSGLFGATGGKAFGLMLVAGAHFDDVNEHHDASLAQLIFFDPLQPIIHNNDTVSYRLVNVGEVRINGLLLARVPQHFTISGISFFDTVIGLQYSLFSKDGIGGRGFQFNSNSQYVFRNLNTPGFPIFAETVFTPAMIRVISPQAGDVIDPSKNLRFQLQGNANEVSIIIRKRPLGNASIEQEKPLLRLKAKKKDDEIVIPSSLLRSLPRQTEKYIFSFQVDVTRKKRMVGFLSDVYLTGSYVHHLMLKIKQ